MWIGMRFNPGTIDPKQLLAGPLHNNVIHIGNTADQANAQFSWVARTDFSDDASMKYRLSVWLLASASRMVGKHTVLLVARTGDANTQIRARLSMGWELPVDLAGSNVFSQYDIGEVSFSNIAWKIYDFGVHKFPGLMPRRELLDLEPGMRTRVNLEAERTSGSSWVEWGVLYLPYGEARIYIDGAHCMDDMTLHLATSPDYMVDGVVTDGTSVIKPAVAPINWAIPSEGAWCSIVHERELNHDPADIITLSNMTWFRSWQSYRD